MNKKEKIIGIDLGTTNSEVAIIIDGKPMLLKIDGNKVVPSVVSISSDGVVLVGRPAANAQLLDPENTVRLIKRKMGREELISIHGKDYTPSMVSGLILARLKKAAEDFCGEPITKAVITVPAFFNEKQREATKLAGELAGLEVLRLLNEPTAAALSYSLGRKEKEISLVYDLGGGTFDVSVVDLSSGVMEVLASDGDVELGGSDFDLMIAEKAKEEFLKEHGIDLSQNPLSWLRILQAAEAAKIRLSKESDADIIEEFIAEKKGIPLHLRLRITRVEFENMIRSVLERTIECVKRAMEQASIRSDQLDRVILVGGSTYIPLVSQLLEKELLIVPQAWLNPEIVVAQGAAVEGATLAGESLGTIMLDITPHSLGTECLNEFDILKNDILIRKNTQLPCVASKVFYKMHPNQDLVNIIVYQGESDNLARVTKIGDFELEGLGDSEGSAICVKFELDRSAILQVTATDVSSGKKIFHTIERSPEEAMRTMNLADLKALRIEVLDEEEIEAEGEDNPLVKEVMEMVSVTEELIQKALEVLKKDTISFSDKEEIRNCLESVKTGDSTKKLEELLYYLD